MTPLRDLENVFNSIADPILVKDRQHRWVLLNDAYCKFMGVERQELIGKSDYDFFPKEQADVFWTKDECVFKTGVENVNDEAFTDVDGMTHSITTKKSLYISPEGEKFIVGCIRDLTELKRVQEDLQRARIELEATVGERTAALVATNEALARQVAENEYTSEQLRQSQKMEAIGRLAGGIAHDFNNLLNVVIGYASLIERNSDPGTNQRQNAEQVLAAAEKAALLTRQLLAFSRKQLLQPEVLSMSHILASMAPMLDRLLGEDIEMVMKIREGLGYVKADRGQIEMIVMNLVVNARDAMPVGGILTIEASNATLQPESQEVRETGLVAGEYVMLTVADTGKGMEADTLEHIFEPFFTTKPVGKGTGLGLATVHGIVNQNAGGIRVNSELGKGTTLRIYLPRIPEGVALPAEQEREPSERLRPQSGTLLLVEDQKELRSLLSAVLEAEGYQVLSAPEAKSALELICRYKGALDLLITDVVMPGMRGWDFARQVTALYPSLPVLYISGHTDSDGGAVLRPGETLLEKPFRPEVLLHKIRQLLHPKVAAST